MPATAFPITLTTFADFIHATPSGRIACVTEARQFYAEPVPFRLQSYYLGLKQGIDECFRRGGDKDRLAQVLAEVDDPKKAGPYAECVAGLRKWMGRKAFEYVGVDAQPWTASSLRVSVNPELGVRINDEPHIIKLYLKDQALQKRRIDPILRLLEVTHGARGQVGVLDVRRGKLFVPTRTIRGLDSLLEAEAAAFVHLWTTLPARAA